MGLLLLQRPRGPQGTVALLASAKIPDYLSVSGPQAEIGARDSPITTIIPEPYSALAMKRVL